MHFYAIFTPFHLCTQLQNKKHTPFFPGLHIKVRQLANLRLSIFQPSVNCHITSHNDSMNQLQQRNVAKRSSIHTSNIQKFDVNSASKAKHLQNDFYDAYGKE